MTLIRRFRLWKARLTGLQIEQWQSDDPVYPGGGGKLLAWKLTAAGTYEYRPLTAEEDAEHDSRTIW